MSIVSESVRIHEEQATARFWWGTMADVTDVIRRAQEVLAGRSSGEALREYIKVDFVKGDQSFQSVDAFAQAVAKGIQADEVTRVYASLEAGAPGDAADEITVSFQYGASMATRGRDLIWVEGAAKVLGDVLAAHEQPPYQPGYKLGLFEWFVFGFVVLALPGVITLAILGDYPLAGYIVNIALWVVLTFISIPVLNDARIETDHLRILDADLPQRPSRPETLVVRIDRFIRARPVLNLLVGFVFGVVVNKVSDLL